MTNVKSLKVYSDASGAPAVVESGGYVFACDTLGRVSLTCIRPRSGSRIASKIAARKAEAAYVAARDAEISVEWLAQNLSLYA